MKRIQKKGLKSKPQEILRELVFVAENPLKPAVQKYHKLFLSLKFLMKENGQKTSFYYIHFMNLFINNFEN